MSDDLVLAKDLAPTILELAGVDHPGTARDGRPIEAMTGRSAWPVFEGGEVAERVHADELIGKRGVRVGNWKLVHMPPPYGSGGWELYDLSSDLAETNDLAEAMPDKVAELVEHWERYAEENGVVLPDWVSGY